ncbi:MGMT family protein [Candidatus Dojkabacteria bacterium]|nr:MGMT family protein [Candidatus Dojkabacteria bacterium]
MAKETWIQKRDKETKSQRKMTPKGMMYISTPTEINEMIRKIPKGKVTTTKQMTDFLSKKYKTDFTCPLTTGIFVSICANAAQEEEASGKKDVVPYWRVIKDKGKLYDKYLGNTDTKQKKLLESDGQKIVPPKRGKGEIVENWEDSLFEF